MLRECLQRVIFLLQKPYLGFATVVVCEADIVDATAYADGLRWSPEIRMDEFSICARTRRGFCRERLAGGFCLRASVTELGRGILIEVDAFDQSLFVGLECRLLRYMPEYFV